MDVYVQKVGPAVHRFLPVSAKPRQWQKRTRMHEAGDRMIVEFMKQASPPSTNNRKNEDPFGKEIGRPTKRRCMIDEVRQREEDEVDVSSIEANTGISPNFAHDTRKQCKC